ncbi:MAG: hypothetical protein COB17_10025 [Sulfurimonas sp.]|nr:MAG: hypothetical protein COB17_10025 [Sulfurimonas sp.]
MHQAYKLSILYYLIFVLLLITSAVMLFKTNIGISPNLVLDYYIGNEERFITAKSSLGILKIIKPHIFTFALLSMVLLHFLIFTNKRYKKSTLFLIYVTYIVAIMEMFSPILIINGYEFFAYVKLFSFFFFLTLLVYISWLLFYSITFD